MVNLIMEGANHNSPSGLYYAKLPSTLVSIDENVNAFIYQRNKFLLYGETKDFLDINLREVNFEIVGGFDLDRKGKHPLCLWTIFEMQRSFITQDGRIYVNSGFFEGHKKIFEFYTEGY